MSFYAKILEKIVKFCIKTLEKPEIMKNNKDEFSALPPKTHKGTKTKISNFSKRVTFRDYEIE